MAGKRPKKIRVDFRKNREARVRAQNLTHRSLDDLDRSADLEQGERLTGKGALTRRRTVIADETGEAPQRAVDEARCLRGRVLQAIGSNHCAVQTDAGARYECTVRRVVRTMSRDARNAVVAGDDVLFLPAGAGAGTGVIERVEPRRGVISRGSARHEHVIVANVDQAVIVASAADPPLKPALVDRFLVSAEKGGVRAIVCINKVDLVDAVELQPVAGVYARIGYDVVLTSSVTGEGIVRLRELLAGKESVLAGQSGVGKSSLINALDPALQQRTSEVSEDTGKGRHTTRTSKLLPLSSGGWLVDTPGIRQMQLWDVSTGEVEGYFREFRSFVTRCRFPDCAHTHEEGCGVKRAVRDGLIARTRYHGYLRIVLGDE